MPMAFEQVTADIEREPERSDAGRPPAPAAPPDITAQLEQALRLQAEREARVCDR